MRSALPLVLTVVLATLAASACASPTEPFESQEEPVTPIDRLILGRGAKYPADLAMRERLPELVGSQAARRAMAWSVIARVLTPVGIAAPTLDPGDPRVRGAVPRFQTWYSKDDVVPMFGELFGALPDADKARRTPFTRAQIEASFPWNARVAPTLASFTKDRYQKRLGELRDAAGVQSLGKAERTLLSPASVAHLFESYGPAIGCVERGLGSSPGSATPGGPFAPCLAGEFPEDGAAAVKARWMPTSSPLPVYDTSAPGLTAKLGRADGAWGDGDGTRDPGPDAIYTMRLSDAPVPAGMRLAGLHIVSKELKDWVWITMWWSPDLDSDFGADRPRAIADLGGPWKNYKMCVVTAFDERDPDPRGGLGATHPSLGDALAATGGAALGPSWCSNPYVELGPKNLKTNCIGCHQHAGTALSSPEILGDESRFPQNSRAKTRAQVPSDYSWAFSGNLELAQAMKDQVDARTPARP